MLGTGLGLHKNNMLAPFNPLRVDGTILWSKAKIEERDDWNTSGFQLDNEADATTNLKAKTGGYYVANSATGDYIDIPEITLSGDFSIHYYINLDIQLNDNLVGDQNTTNHFLYIQTSLVRFRADGDTINFDYNLSGLSGFHSIVVIRSDSTANLYIDGDFIETKSFGTGDFVLNSICKTSAATQDGEIKDIALFNTALTASQISNLYNNPQRFVELSREYGAERIYDFNIGNGEVGYPVWDLSVNEQHGTIQSNSAPAGTNFIYNDAEVGTQQVLESRNRYYWFDGVDDQVSFTSQSLANRTITIRLQYRSSGEYQFIQLSDEANTGKYIAATINYATGNDLGFSSHDAGLPFPTQSYEYNDPTFIDGQMITIVMTTDASGELISVTIDGNNATDTGLSIKSRINSTGALNNFLIGSRAGASFAYKGIIDFFNFDDSIVSYNYTGWSGGTVSGTPSSIFITESSTKGIDLFGNAITDQWKQGLLNFTGLDLIDNAHRGVEFGDQIDTLDVSDGRVIVLVVKRKSNGIDQNLLANRNTDDGFRLSISDAANKVAFINEVGGVAVPKSTTNLILEDELYFIGILQKPSGDLTIWLEELNNEISTGENFTSIGSIGLGSLIPTIGINPNKVSNPFNGIMTAPILYDKSSISLTEINNLRKYLKSLIS